ncbi:MAG: hypothetical protein O3C21_01095 [Verrucomicrobia bacterium]|nr:hypothetical protein [Verrucomicrobiota bacterium]
MALRRILVSLLILLALAGGGVALFSHWRKRFHSEEGTAPFKITKVEVKRDFANAVLTLTVDYDNRAGDAEVTTAATTDDPNGARLVTASGKAPPLFFLPGVIPPVIKAGEQAEVTVIYWLDRDHLRDALKFESKGQSVAVKNASPFDLNAIENQTSVTFTDPNWKLP